MFIADALFWQLPVFPHETFGSHGTDLFKGKN